MRIIALHASNIKRLRVVDITPDPSSPIVPVTGRNAQGKSSVLDSIWLALGGRDAAKSTDRPIRDGESKAEVTVDLGDLVVTRSWTANDKSYLRVTAKDGRRYSSPQQVLDDLVGRLSFNPVSFMAMHPKEQVATLLDLLRLPIDIPAMDVQRAKLYDQRTEIGRRLDALKGQLSGMTSPPPDLPAEEINAADLLREMQAATNQRAANDQLMRDLERATERVEQTEQLITDLENKLASAKEILDKDQADVARLLEKIASIEDPDTAALENRIASVETVNQAIRAEHLRQSVAADLQGHEDRYAKLTQAIADIDEDKAKAVREAHMPIAGLGFTMDGLVYNNVPLKQASAAEQLRVSVAMAMALNPKLRVIRITDGSLLDADNLAIIADMAMDNDFQVWVERVADEKGIGIHIEDGSVV